LSIQGDLAQHLLLIFFLTQIMSFLLAGVATPSFLRCAFAPAHLFEKKPGCLFCIRQPGSSSLLLLVQAAQPSTIVDL
jgi:hypothetical protein